ncbi:MAG: protein kinase [Planctomycetota bacterium]
MSTPERSILDLMRAEGRPAPRILLRALEGDAEVGARHGKLRYELIDKIAQGGVGVVWRARDVDLGRHAAIKVLREAHRGSADTIERFVEEAQIGGQLQHPGIVPVYGLGVLEDYRPYFAMKLVKGQTLAELLKDRDDPAKDRRKLLSYFEHICHTVAYAHARGVIHRDLKPRNIMIGSFDEVQVVDWGFAKVLAQGGVADERRAKGAPDPTVIATVRTESDESDSVAGSVMGTAGYMPPEQALGMLDELDERSDVFALGAVLCEILTGSPPYSPERGSLYEQAANAKLEHANEALDACGADDELIELAKRCIAPLRGDRPRSAQTVARSVTEYLTSVEERAHRAELAAIAARAKAAETRERAERARLAGLEARRARFQTVAIAAALLLLVAGSGATYFWMRHDRVARERSSMASIDEALQEARFHEGRAEWVEAIAAAQRSHDLARAADAGTATRDRVQGLVVRYEDAKRRAGEDRAMAERLELLRSRWSNGDNHKQTDADFADAFREYGYDVYEGEPEMIGARLKRRRIAAELAAALDEWSLLRRAARKLKGTDWNHLLDIARAADPDELRNKVRDATATRDYQALRALSKEPDLPAKTMLLLGHGTTVAGDPPQGMRVLRQAVLRYPRDPWVHARLAYSSDMLKDRKASVRNYTAAVALRPTSAQMNLQLGDALVLDHQSTNAIPMYRRAIEFGPHIVRAYVGLSLALYDQKDYGGTIEACEGAIENAPPDPLPHYLKATALRQQRKFDEAEASFKKALELGPDYAMIHREMGSMYLQLRRYKDAAGSYEKAVEIKPSDFNAWFQLGSARQSFLALDEALEAFHRARALQPDDAVVNLWIARMHWLKHEWAKALPWLERAHRLGTGTGRWTYPTARFIEQAKVWQHIEPRLPALLNGEEKPRDAEEMQHIAELCYESKKYGASLRFWRELFDKHPKFEVLTARYNAICTAALAGAPGRSKDKVEDLPTARALAHVWLERNLQELRAQPKARLTQRLNHWKYDSDLKFVREQLSQMPESERRDWQRFWAQVDALLAE